MQKAEVEKAVVNERTRGMSDDVVWFRLVHHYALLLDEHRYAQFHYYETNLVIAIYAYVIMMSLSKFYVVRKGLDEFRYATQIMTIDMLFMVFPYNRSR